MQAAVETQTFSRLSQLRWLGCPAQKKQFQFLVKLLVMHLDIKTYLLGLTSQLQQHTVSSKPSQLSKNETRTSEAAWMPMLFQALAERIALSTIFWTQFPLGLSLRFHEQLCTVITVP